MIEDFLQLGFFFFFFLFCFVKCFGIRIIRILKLNLWYLESKTLHGGHLWPQMVLFACLLIVGFWVLLLLRK